MRTVALPLVALLAVVASARELPCPEPRPAFDCTKIDRTLKEPAYGSEKPAYRFLAFGPEGKTIVALVADESQGTGKGVDTLYVDLNANHDLTEPRERFSLEKPRPAPEPASKTDPSLVTLSLSNWGKDLVAERPLNVPDTTFAYTLQIGSGFLRVVTTAREDGWEIPLHALDGSVPWSTSRERAPVLRFGGREFSLSNESFVWNTSGRHATHEPGVGRTLRPGTLLTADAVTPFFAGSSPEAAFAANHCWVPRGHRGLRAWVEAKGGPEPVLVPIVLRDY